MHGYKILHEGDLNENEKSKEKLFILSIGIEGLRNLRARGMNFSRSIFEESQMSQEV